MLREAAVLGNDSGAVRALAWEVDANAEIARALEQAGSNTCLREALMITLARGNSPSSNPRKGQDPCASRDLIIARMIHNQHEPFFIGETRAWLWKGESSVLWSGPRSDALRSNELRYLGGPKSTDSHELRGPWSVAMLEGIPRMQAEVQFSLSYERTVDAAAAIEVMPGDKPAGNEVPNVSVFFAARNVQARSHGPARDRTAIPMRAQGITIRSGRVALADVEADLYGSNPETLRITPKAAQAVELPRTGQIAIRVARDAGGTTVEVAGKKLRFDTGAAAPGFIGIAMEGPGFVRVGQPKIAALK
jgi:hypothetical protein